MVDVVEIPVESEHAGKDRYTIHPFTFALSDNISTMKKFSVHFISLLLSISVLLQSGCFGSFGLTQKVYQWNSSVEDKTVRSILFFVLCVIPVYPVAAFADWIIFNVIEYWEGTNPLVLQPGEVEEQRVTIRGRQMRMEATTCTMKVFEQKKKGEVLLAVFHYDRSSHTWHLQKDGKQTPLVQFGKSADGSVQAFAIRPDGEKVVMELKGMPVAWSTLLKAEQPDFVAVR
jgi:hypothetical protein